MTSSLIETKLYPPQSRKRLVSRERLLDRLNEGLDRRLVLISAPAGYGKTTSIEEWIGDLDRPLAWLSLDDSDNEPYEFLNYIVAALSRLESDFGLQITSALQSSSPPPLGELVDNLSTSMIGLDKPFILVLDDYHVITDLGIHEMIATMIERLPPSATLVMLTREDPQIQISRMRAHDELLEIRAYDLKFSRAEAETFFNETMGLGLSTNEVAMLEARTEGWIAGLVLAGHSLAVARDRWAFLRDFAGDDRHIVDYLAEEVLNGLPDEIEAFLLKTSVLMRLSAPLCQSVVFGGGPPGQAQTILEQLERTNLFTIALDQRREWYRYHPLFRELLRSLLAMKTPDQVAELHLRASDWFEKNGNITQAIDHAQAAQDSDRVLDLISKHAIPMLSRAEVRVVQSWFAKLDEIEIESRPYLCIVFAWSIWLANYTDPPSSIERWVSSAEQALSLQGSEALNSRMVPGHIHTLRAAKALFSGGDPESAIDRLTRTLQTADEDDLWLRSMVMHLIATCHLMVGNVATAMGFDDDALQLAASCKFDYLILGIHFDQALIAMRQGRLSDAEARCVEGIRVASRPGQQLSPSSGMLQVLLGIVLLERNDLESAEQMLTKGLDLLSLTAEKELSSLGVAELARLYQARGEWERAQDLIQQIDAGTTWSKAYRSALQALLWIREAEFEPTRLNLVTEWAQEAEQSLDWSIEIPAALPTHDLVFATLAIWIRARLAAIRQRSSDIRETEAKDVLGALEAQLAFSGARGWNERTLTLLILESLALSSFGDSNGALGKLRKALTLGDREGYVRLFSDEGSEIGRLLHEIVVESDKGDYVGKLLAAFPDAETIRLAARLVDEEDTQLIEPLSERELEVLHLIAEGLSNREIAQRLFVSTNTIKGHSRNIYGKLGVHSRTQAAARARVLGLLPPA